MNFDKQLKSYSDSYLYQKHPRYQKILFDAILKDPMIDKSTDEFQDVIYEIKRSKYISESLVRILNSTNTVLLDCVNPMPRTFKVFCAKDPKSKVPSQMKVFIDCTNVITKRADSSDYIVDDVKLISYLMNAGISMVYHKNYTLITRRSEMMTEATTCFAKLFTSIS